MMSMALDYLAFERIILLIKDRLVGGKVLKLAKSLTKNFCLLLEKIIKTIIC